MTARSALASLVVLCAACGSGEETTPPAIQRDPLTHVNPFVGTGGYAFGHGSVFPGASAPHGFAKVGPDTADENGNAPLFIHYSGYYTTDTKVRAFSHLHMHGTGATDYGVLGVMPVHEEARVTPAASKRMGSFDKATEVATPGYYGLTLKEGGIKVDLTATPHAAHHRYTWTSGDPWIVFDLDHHLAGGDITDAEVTLEPATKTIRGHFHHIGGMSGRFDGYTVYFTVRTKQAWTAQKVWTKGVAPADGTQAAGIGVGFALHPQLAAGEAAEFVVGISLVDAEGATKNLDAEIPTFDFDGTRRKTEGEWSKLLSRVRIFGGTDDDATMFYSALRHTLMMPSWVGDTDGRYRYDGKVGTASFHFLNDFSLWDTYRTLHPLYAIFAPESALASVRSLTEMGKVSGFFPIWPLATGESDVMLGASAEIVLADAYMKGITDFDATAAYDIMRAAAMNADAPAAGRGGRSDVRPGGYLDLGYVPMSPNGKPEDDRSVSKTTEYAHNDYALSNLARALGKTADADALLTRSRGYRKLYDPATKFLRARLADGTLAPGEFSEFSWSHYAEANAWHSLWMAAHDLDGFADLFGGKPQMVARLEEMLAKSAEEQVSREDETLDELSRNLPRKYYWAANEPDIHAVFMFAQAGRPDLTQQWLPWMMRTYYSPTPDGLPGNDDGGTMSAWWVFGALGFYPLPGSDLYIVGAPAFPRIELDVGGGVFTIEAKDVSATNLYVQSATLNGQPLTKPEFRHADLKAGGSLVFVMGPVASSWGR